MNSAFTAHVGIERPMVFAGKGHAADFRRLDAKGRIVVIDADVAPSGQPYAPRAAHAVFDPLGHLSDRVWSAHFASNILGGFIPGVAEGGEAKGLIAGLAARRDAILNAEAAGAAGVIVLLPPACGMEVTSWWPYDATPKNLPALYVPASHAAAVREAAVAGRSARMLLEGSREPGQTHNLWATLPGMSAETVMVTSHHDSPHRGAVEDASGVAQVLLQMQRWAAVPRAQRRHTLVFVLAAGHFARGMGAAEFARRHPEIMANVRGLITVEHTPALEFKPGADGTLVATGRPQASTVWVPDDAAVIGKVKAALARRPQPSLTVESPAFGGAPFTDAAGYVAVAKEQRRSLPYASWISAPCYLITDQDTPDKIDAPRLEAVGATVDALVDAFME